MGVFKIDYFNLPLFWVPNLKSMAQNEWKKHPYKFFLLLVQWKKLEKNKKNSNNLVAGNYPNL